MKHDRTPAIARAIGLELPLDALDALDGFEALLRTRALALGFVNARDEPILRERHIDDCIRAAPLVDAGAAVDVGSGAGLPGIVVAIARPDVVVDLVEPRRRRLAFLELAVEELGLANAVPVGSRVEDVRRVYPTALARAFGDPARTWAAAEPVLQRGGRLVYFAGARFEAADVADLPVRVNTVRPPPPLASAGPLVIMTRK